MLQLIGQRTLHTWHRLPQRRSFAVYAIGEGWTGALGTGRFDETLVGHNDEEENVDLPVLVYDKPVKDAAVGWGHTALINEDSQLLLTGRPHDFSNLMRLRRLPRTMRNYMVRHAVESIHNRGNSLHPSNAIGNMITWLTEIFQPEEQKRDWAVGEEYSILSQFTPFDLPEAPRQVACSAGLTAVVGETGKLYTFGLNSFGQCGIGLTSNNVWQPTVVTGLSTEFSPGPRAELEQQHPITDVALGLQHGVCQDSEGNVFCWGKGERGTLGQEIETPESHSALLIRKCFYLDERSKPIYQPLSPVKQIASGLLHSAALAEDNQVLIWGKHVLPTLPGGQGKKPASDSRLPSILMGLPEGRTVEQIACGSHHTAVLLSDESVWAVGISSDTKEPMHTPVELIPPGTIDVPIRQFAAHMDRTTVVGADGRQVLQVHLWKDPELQYYAIFTPAVIEAFLDEDETRRIQQIHRSWIHSIIVTED